MIGYFSAGIILLGLYAALDKFYNVRLYDLERQDKSESEGRYTREEYLDMMHMLADLNVADPTGHNATMAAFESVFPAGGKSPDALLEIGFGLGTFSIMLGRKYPTARVTGIDVHQLSVDLATENLAKHNAGVARDDQLNNVHFELRNAVELDEPPKSYDVITTTMVNHHIFPDEAFVDFLRRVAVVGRRAFIFNDFHRSLKCTAANTFSLLAVRYLGHAAVSWLSRNIFPSNPFGPYEALFAPVPSPEAGGGLVDRPGLDLFIDGGILSERRAFSMAEYAALFREAGYPPEAARCHTMDEWWETVQSRCRVVCVVDLAWKH